MFLDVAQPLPRVYLDLRDEGASPLFDPTVVPEVLPLLHPGTAGTPPLPS